LLESRQLDNASGPKEISSFTIIHENPSHYLNILYALVLIELKAINRKQFFGQITDDKLIYISVTVIVNPYLTKLNWLATNSPASYTPTHKRP
jgi:hypothetical protein